MGDRSGSRCLENCIDCKALPKKGDLSLCHNWRGITLLSITSKVLTRVIFDRISAAVDPLLREEQALKKVNLAAIKSLL